MSDAKDFCFFWAGPFSQWHPTSFCVGAFQYNCAEQFMMYCKASIFGDEQAAERILKTRSPRSQKLLGRRVERFDEERWKIFREGIAFTGNLAKFSQNMELRTLLLSTGEKHIVEASPKDRIWGIGLAESDPRALNIAEWRGENLLGTTLMRVRSWLRDKNQISPVLKAT